MTDQNMYAEVWKILNHMNLKEVERIPPEKLVLIRDERNKEYKDRINPQDLFNPANIDQRSVNFLTYLMINYMASPEQREQLIRIGKENDRKKGIVSDTKEETKRKYCVTTEEERQKRSVKKA